MSKEAARFQISPKMMEDQKFDSHEKVEAQAKVPDQGTVVPSEEVKTKYSGITRNDFPAGFVFGTGTSAYQVEGGAAAGGRGPSVWDVFTMKSPGRTSDGSNGNLAIDMINTYKEDIRMMKSMGFDAYRFSISWSRVIPSGKICLGVNKEGIDYYNDLINTCHEYGITPYVTLFHWDLPYTLEKEYGGFLSKDIVDDFVDFAKLCFWEFGDRVDRWFTFNEPWTYCYHGYVSCLFPPGKRIFYMSDQDSEQGTADHVNTTFNNYRISNYNCLPPPTVYVNVPNENNFTASSDDDDISAGKRHHEMSDYHKQVFIAAKNLILAHAAVVKLYNQKFKERQQGQIGITLVTCWFEPISTKRGNKRAARRALDFMLGWFLEPVVKGSYPKNMAKHVPDEAKFSSEESKMLRKNKIDFLGVNYYTARYVENNDNKDRSHIYLHPFIKYQYCSILENDKNGQPIGTNPGESWVLVVPWGIKSLLNKINELYNNSDDYTLPAIYITENGFSDPNNHRLTAPEAVVDKSRVEYHREHLGNIMDVINKLTGPHGLQKNLDIKGYFAWSWADNFEWTAGYTVRFGIIYVDYMNNLKRYPKQSAIWLSQFLAGQVHKYLDGEEPEDNDDDDDGEKGEKYEYGEEDEADDDDDDDDDE